MFRQIDRNFPLMERNHRRGCLFGCNVQIHEEITLHSVPLVFPLRPSILFPVPAEHRIPFNKVSRKPFRQRSEIVAAVEQRRAARHREGICGRV
jgi:hypothetical protein